jgi:hypothetical protein
MTAANPPATSPEVAPFPFDRQAWGAWLTGHTDPQWRPDEWNQEHWLFTGDPDKETTAIWRCYRTGCHVAARASRHLCRSCYGEWLRWPAGALTAACQPHFRVQTAGLTEGGSR